jgi:hypothetical protein
MLQIIPPRSLAEETREKRRRFGGGPLGARESERKVIHTEVWRLYACKSVLCKYDFPPDLSGVWESTASHAFQSSDRQSRSPP